MLFLVAGLCSRSLGCSCTVLTAVCTSPRAQIINDQLFSLTFLLQGPAQTYLSSFCCWFGVRCDEFFPIIPLIFSVFQNVSSTRKHENPQLTRVHLAFNNLNHNQWPQKKGRYRTGVNWWVICDLSWSGMSGTKSESIWLIVFGSPERSQLRFGCMLAQRKIFLLKKKTGRGVASSCGSLEERDIPYYPNLYLRIIH